MVVVEGATILNLVASIMMNGVCCIHAMEEEERRKKDTEKTMRKVMNVEWQRQRLMDQEHHERFLRDQEMDTASVMTDERRRLYMVAKMRATSQHSSRASYSSQQSRSLSRREYRHYDSFVAQRPVDKRDGDCDQRTLPESPCPEFHYGDDAKKRKNDYNTHDELIGLDSRFRSVPIVAGHKTAQIVPLLLGPTSSMNSSLFDDDSDDEAFDDVNLH